MKHGVAKIAAISDIHGNLPALEAVLSDIATQGVDLIVNPGSVGLQRFDDDHVHPHVIETRTPHARYALIERSAIGWNISLRSVAYDWEAAARRAEREGRPDWAEPLRTGFVLRSSGAPA